MGVKAKITAKTRKAFVEAAHRIHHNEGTIEVDVDYKPSQLRDAVSVAENILDAGGAYVKAWVWVPLEELEKGGV